MTLKFLEGFESSRTDSDLRSRNILQINTTSLMVPVPSTTGVGGYGVAQLSAANTSHTSTPFIFNTTGGGAAGWWTGTTVNSAWNAGGFAFGISARSNLGTAYSYGAGASNGSYACSAQACYDGSKYWAVQLTGSTYTIATSPDLQNWTTTGSQPTLVNAYTTISYLGNGVICVVPYASSSSTAIAAYYTSNNGATWSTQSLGTASASTSGAAGSVIATGNSTYPHAALLVAFATSGGSNQGGVYVGTMGGTMTQVITVAGSNVASYNTGRLIGGLVVLPIQAGASNAIYSATASNVSLNTAGAWSTATLSSTLTVTDIAYNPNSNLWVLSTLSGIWTFPNTGAAGTAVAPTGAQTVTQRYTTATMQNVFWTGSVMVAMGLQGHIITSSDGVTWSETGGHIIPVGTSGTDWRSAFYDGSKYVLFSDATTACVATSTDGVNNYQCQYTSDKAFSAATTNDNNGISVIPITQTTQPTNPPAGAFVGTSGNISYTVTPSAVTSGTITAYVAQVNYGNSTSAAGSSVVATGVTTRAAATHYYEFVYTKSTTTNAFTFQLFIDGVSAYGPTGAVQVAGTADTTSVLLISLPTTQCVSQFDDMYFITLDGQGMGARQGVLNIVAQRPATDVQAQWVKNGTAASNSLSVATSALSSVPGNYVSSATSGDKDIYKFSSTLPTGYTVKGVQVDAMMTKTSTTNPVVNIGVLSGSTESDSANVTLATQGAATLVSLPLDKDPNGNVAWTAASVQASQTVLNHVT